MEDAEISKAYMNVMWSEYADALYLEGKRITFIDTASSALASGAGIALDSLCALFSRSDLCTLPPPAPCLSILPKSYMDASVS